MAKERRKDYIDLTREVTEIKCIATALQKTADTHVKEVKVFNEFMAEQKNLPERMESVESWQKRATKGFYVLSGVGLALGALYGAIKSGFVGVGPKLKLAGEWISAYIQS